MSRHLFLDAVHRRNASGRAVYGTGTSIACKDLMDLTSSHFPEAHTDAEKMARLAIAGHEVLGLDAVMPLFSVVHEAAAVGCAVQWGSPTSMPESGKPIFATVDDIRVPADLLDRPACRVPLRALTLLRKRLGDSAAVCGKVLSGWTLAYHLMGVESFLIGTLDDPAATQRILDTLLPVALTFGRAQVEAGADVLVLADHATRDLCGPDAYRRFVLPMLAQFAAAMPVPVILHTCGDTSDRIGMIATTGLACLHWDTKTGPPAKVRGLAGQKLALMGGVSNALLLCGRCEEIAAASAEAVRDGIDIVGPECAIPLLTPLANLKAIAAAGAGGRGQLSGRGQVKRSECP